MPCAVKNTSNFDCRQVLSQYIQQASLNKYIIYYYFIRIYPFHKNTFSNSDLTLNNYNCTYHVTGNKPYRNSRVIARWTDIKNALFSNSMPFLRKYNTLSFTRASAGILSGSTCPYSVFTLGSVPKVHIHHSTLQCWQFISVVISLICNSTLI